MANFLGLVNGLPGHSYDTPGHELPNREHDDFFADRDTAASAHYPLTLPSFPEAFGSPNDCHRHLFPSSLYFQPQQQQQQQQRRLPVSSSSSTSSPPLPPPLPPANNVPRAPDNATTDLAPLHPGQNTSSSNSDSLNHNRETSVSETPAFQWPDGAPADLPFSCLSHAPPHSQRQCQQQHQQHQHQNPHPHPHSSSFLSFNDCPVNPHPFFTGLGDLDLVGLNWDPDLHHHTHHCTTQQPPPSPSQAPLRRPALSPTTTVPSTACLDSEYAPISSQAPPFSTLQVPHLPSLPLQLPPLPARPQPPSRPRPALGGDHSIDTGFPAQFPGINFEYFPSAPDDYDRRPFPLWHPQSMTTGAPGLNLDSFELEAAMPSFANPPSARRRSSRRLSNSVVDLTKEESRDDLASSSPVPMAPPPSRKRRRSTTAGGGTSASDSRRNSASQASKAIKTEAMPPGSRGGRSCVFGSSPPPAFSGDEDVLDLTETTEASADQKIEVDRRVKLSKFQCVICMDDVSNLTVTHCGHLFCSECLHSALHIDSTKKSCPVCRTKVDLRSKTGKNTKSYYHLELKVMTATRKGKQPAAATR